MLDFRESREIKNGVVAVSNFGREMGKTIGLAHCKLEVSKFLFNIDLNEESAYHIATSYRIE